MGHPLRNFAQKSQTAVYFRSYTVSYAQLYCDGILIEFTELSTTLQVPEDFTWQSWHLSSVNHLPHSLTRSFWLSGRDQAVGGRWRQ